MKKLTIALLLILNAGACFGAVSEERVDDNHFMNAMYILLGLLVVIISLLIAQKLLYIRETLRQTVKLEDVKRLIAENNAELMKSMFTKAG